MLIFFNPQKITLILSNPQKNNKLWNFNPKKMTRASLSKYFRMPPPPGSKQHHQIEICEVSHFLYHFGTGSLQTIFLLLKQTVVSLKQQEMCILATWDFHGQNEFMLKMYFLPVSWDKRQIVVCVTFWAIFFSLKYFHNRIWQTLGNA